MKQIILLLAAFLSCQILLAQDVTYVLFNRDCMNQLEYRYSYPNLKGDNAVWAYSVRPNVQEHYIFMTEGAGHFSPELPQGTVTCRDLNLDDAFVASINREDQQMLIVFQRQSGGYWLMPVESATLVARKAAKYWVRAKQSSFQFDTVRLVNEQNLAVAGSPTAAYFSGAKLNNCLMEYSFHCDPVKPGKIRSDFQFIPSIGVTNDRTGSTASSAMENELQLVKVNGAALDDYLKEACPEGAGKIAISKYQKPASYGEDSFESDKEITSIMQKEQDVKSPATYSTGPNGIQCAEDWEPGTHIVQKKENLRAIARTYKVSEQDLIKWNKIQNPDLIEVCQKLWLKPPPAKTTKRTTTSNKGLVKPQVESAPLENTKTVKMQGQGTVPVQKGAARKTYDPNRAVEYSDGPTDDNDYAYFEPATTNNDDLPKIHIVHRGEYLYKIAKMYGCPEECIRIANSMPLEGDEPLTIGQELIIPECTCTVDGKTIKRPTATTKKPTVKKQTPAASTDRQGYNQGQKPRTSILDESEAPGLAAAEYNYDDDRVYKDEDRYEETSLYEDDAAKGTSKESKVQLYKEHLVKQGETLNSIAAKYKVEAAKLAKANGLKPKEVPTPGKIFLIPIEEKEEEDEQSPSGKKSNGYNPNNYGEVEDEPASNNYASPSSGTAKKAQPYSKSSGAPATNKSSFSGTKKPNPNPEGDFPTVYDYSTMPDESIENPGPKPATSKFAPKGKNPAPKETKSTQHLVKKGETIQTIADKYNVSAFELSQINNIGIDDSLIPGRKIWIPVEDSK